ncbi:helix-turn-helix protein [Schleiferia thermophila]|uniref:Helix-turn-helix protein n=2 Tax=Schleiferia thermophila TaxID=884107 RepID=A0A368ZXK4_9FLAO|nr:helix-turn-helix protein [Schleiferia thermophila]
MKKIIEPFSVKINPIKQNNQIANNFYLSHEVRIFVETQQNKAITSLLRLFHMISFGKKIAALRKEKRLSQTELANKLNTSVSVISRYERDEMTPSIETAKKLATLLNTTVGYLLGETEDDNLLKDPKMVSRLKELREFSEQEKEQVYFNLDAVIREIKNRKTYAL